MGHGVKVQVRALNILKMTGKVSVSRGGFRVRYMHNVRSSYAQLQCKNRATYTVCNQFLGFY